MHGECCFSDNEDVEGRVVVRGSRVRIGMLITMLFVKFRLEISILSTIVARRPSSFAGHFV